MSETSINRRELVRRHNIKQLGREKCFALGNGEFCFSGDITGLQTFRGNSMSHWGWHAFPLPDGVVEDEIPDTGCYMNEYPKDGVDRVPPEKRTEADYVFDNPHPMNLGRVRFIKSSGEEICENEITVNRFLQDIYEGEVVTEFAYGGAVVKVTVLSMAEDDGIAVRIETEKTAHAPEVEISFCYPNVEYGSWIGDFKSVDRHRSCFELSADGTACRVERSIDATEYTVWCACTGGKFLQSDSHGIRLSLSELGKTELGVFFFDGGGRRKQPCFEFEWLRETNRKKWHDFWHSGGAIDLSDSKDPRWYEFERRIVLSQYLLAVQSAGSYPCAEAGLMNMDSWKGQFHMEMIWWHVAHYAMWGRFEMADRQLSCYQKFLPVAVKLAEQFGKKGAKWGKQVGPQGRTAPWKGNLALYWKQPHPIFFAELEYRNRPNADTLSKWEEIIEETAEHMVDCAVKRPDGYYHLTKVMPPSEIGFSDDTVFDLAYWRWALEIAGKWRKRLGKERVRRWDEVMENLAPLPVKEDCYIRSPEWTDTYKTQNYEHPDMVGVYGMLPLTAAVDARIVKNTVKKVWEVWKKDQIWGWDFAWIAMCAARVGEPEIAIESLLLMEVDEIGANGNGSYPYLPANGGILFAVAMMCVGKDGEHAPGFPKDGSWVVKSEGLMAW